MKKRFLMLFSSMFVFGLFATAYALNDKSAGAGIDMTNVVVVKSEGADCCKPGADCCKGGVCCKMKNRR